MTRFDPDTTETRQNNNTVYMIGGVILIVAIIIVVLILVSGNNSANGNPTTPTAIEEVAPTVGTDGEATLVATLEEPVATEKSPANDNADENMEMTATEVTASG